MKEVNDIMTKTDIMKLISMTEFDTFHIYIDISGAILPDRVLNGKLKYFIQYALDRHMSFKVTYFTHVIEKIYDITTKNESVDDIIDIIHKEWPHVGGGTDFRLVWRQAYAEKCQNEKTLSLIVSDLAYVTKECDPYPNNLYYLVIDPMADHDLEYIDLFKRSMKNIGFNINDRIITN